MTIVITGASSGIGAACARALAERGATLILHGRNEAALTEVAEEVRGLGGSGDVRVADLADDAQADRFAASLPARIDLLIHSAGIVRLGALADASDEDLDVQIRLNVRAPFRLTRAALPALRAASGLVVFVNSGAGLRANADWGAYAASKHALKALADALRAEEQAHGVRVTSIYPGRTATNMQREVHRQEGRPYDPSVYVPAEEVAAVIAQVARLRPPATVPDVSVRPG